MAPFPLRYGTNRVKRGKNIGKKWKRLEKRSEIEEKKRENRGEIGIRGENRQKIIFDFSKSSLSPLELNF